MIDDIIFVLTWIIALVSIFAARRFQMQRDEAIEALEDLDEEEIVLEDPTERRLQFLHRSLHNLEDQANHIAKVQLLTLKHLGLEHQVQPQRDVLVSISSLEELGGKTKKRG